jgi:hypothetical protein
VAKAILGPHIDPSLLGYNVIVSNDGPRGDRGGPWSPPKKGKIKKKNKIKCKVWF